MKQLFITIGIIGGFVINSYAALITRTYTYTSGNTITANENNTNENTLYAEVNGNLNNANILDGGISTADLADNLVTSAKLDSTIASTITLVSQLTHYQRPVPVYISGTSVDISSNTGTSNETCVIFNNERRCVTEDTASADKYRRFIITSTATFTSGTEDSGMFGSYANNTWIALYAVKSQINSANFVVAGTTNTPVQANFSSLNTMFGTNGWIYLGLIRRGDQNASPAVILAFRQTGNRTVLTNTNAEANPLPGITLADSAGATSLIFTYATGTSGATIPLNTGIVTYVGASSAGSGACDFLNSGSARYFSSGVGSQVCVHQITTAASDGAAVRNASSVNLDINLIGWYDDALGVGSNPGF